jgi:hypothetical protein
LFEMSIMAWQTLQVTMGTPPWEAAVYGGGNSSGPMGDTVAWCPPPPAKKHQNQPLLPTLVGEVRTTGLREGGADMAVGQGDACQRPFATLPAPARSHQVG